MKRLCTIALVVLLTSCASPTVVGCSHLKYLSPEVQGQMAADLELLPKDSPLIPAMLDYLKYRAEAKACLNK
jgi:hypothetical protein